jgi:hypothetical protein
MRTGREFVLVQPVYRLKRSENQSKLTGSSPRIAHRLNTQRRLLPIQGEATERRGQAQPLALAPVIPSSAVPAGRQRARSARAGHCRWLVRCPHRRFPRTCSMGSESAGLRRRPAASHSRVHHRPGTRLGEYVVNVRPRADRGNASSHSPGQGNAVYLSPMA